MNANDERTPAVAVPDTTTVFDHDVVDDDGTPDPDGVLGKDTASVDCHVDGLERIEAVYPEVSDEVLATAYTNIRTKPVAANIDAGYKSDAWLRYWVLGKKHDRASRVKVLNGLLCSKSRTDMEVGELIRGAVLDTLFGSTSQPWCNVELLGGLLERDGLDYTMPPVVNDAVRDLWTGETMTKATMLPRIVPLQAAKARWKADEAAKRVQALGDKAGKALKAEAERLAIQAEKQEARLNPPAPKAKPQPEASQPETTTPPVQPVTAVADGQQTPLPETTSSKPEGECKQPSGLAHVIGSMVKAGSNRELAESIRDLVNDSDEPDTLSGIICELLAGSKELHADVRDVFKEAADAIRELLTGMPTETVVSEETKARTAVLNRMRIDHANGKAIA